MMNFTFKVHAVLHELILSYEYVCMHVRVLHLYDKINKIDKIVVYFSLLASNNVASVNFLRLFFRGQSSFQRDNADANCWVELRGMSLGGVMKSASSDGARLLRGIGLYMHMKKYIWLGETSYNCGV